MKRLIIMTLVALLCSAVSAQEKAFTPSYKYRVTLKDKKATTFSVKHPEQFLSEKAIQRRKRQGLKIDQTDIPVCQVYLNQISAKGAKIVHTSKWNNTALVQVTDTTVMDAVLALPCVTAVRKVATYLKPDRHNTTDRFSLIKSVSEEPEEEDDDAYEAYEPGEEHADADEDEDDSMEQLLRTQIKSSLDESFEEVYGDVTRLPKAKQDSIHITTETIINLAIDQTHKESQSADDEEEEDVVIEDDEDDEDEHVVLADPIEPTEEMVLNALAETMGRTSEDVQPKDEIDYGKGYGQINMLNGIALHKQGYKGKGMTIAVIDGGFYNADIIPALQNVDILGVRDFVNPGVDNVFEEESHGMMVLSTIGTNQPGLMIGTAPEASFYLLRSEDGYTEQLVEEDNWCAAIEYADSVGVDVVNTSLGYTKFDNPADNVKYWELDGHTHLASNSASMAASKGMVLCQSAGNEASYSAWKLIGVPADADNILSVGALRPDGVNTYFSSLGNSADGRIKPDVCAQGEDCAVMGTNGQMTQADGTSFSSPIMCGMVACFWQANPKLTAKQVVEAVRALGHNVAHPDNVFGYGTPNFGK